MPRIALASGLLLCSLALAGQQVEDLGLSVEQLEEKLLFLVNRERSGRGLRELRLDPLLRDVARAHSRKMVAENRIFHDFPGYEKMDGRAARAGVYFSKIGENVARGDTFVIRFFHEQLMASPQHRENILDGEFTHLGVGIEKSGAFHYVTQEFATLFALLSPADAEREMENRLGDLFPGRDRLPEGAAAELRELCRHNAALLLQGEATRKAPDSYGTAAMLTFTFTEMEAGFATLLARFRASRLLCWSLGVAFARSAKNPGGIYAMCAILFPDLRDAPAAGGDLAAPVFAALSRLHKTARKPRLNELAEKIARFSYRQPRSPYRAVDGCRFVSVYQTVSLDHLPQDIAQKMAGRPASRVSGIAVFYPAAEGLPGNYYIVAILGG